MNKLVFVLGKTGLDNLKRKLSDLIPVVDSGGTATIKNDLNSAPPPSSKLKLQITYKAPL